MGGFSLFPLVGVIMGIRFKGGFFLGYLLAVLDEFGEIFGAFY